MEPLTSSSYFCFGSGFSAQFVKCFRCDVLDPFHGWRFFPNSSSYMDISFVPKPMFLVLARGKVETFFFGGVREGVLDVVRCDNSCE